MSVVLVTGSSKGIGFGIAAAFARQGHTVVLNGREDTAGLDAAVKKLQTRFVGNVMGIIADLSDYSAARDMLAEIERTYGPVEVLVNNAGTAHFGLFGHMPPAEISKILADNLQTTLNASHLAMPGMVRAKTGCIINITSVWGVTGASCEVVYSAAKAGVIGFTKALAKELGPSGVRVNAIACGAFETRMNDRLSAEDKAGFIDGIPLGRFGRPEEVGDLAVFLASEKAGYLTGQVVNLDGGMV
ncbi:MAG: SDR family oxidoreductase [Firmicutes bacterium]|nr:SDR family oxidoreductase [Bacillota bacterium]